VTTLLDHIAAAAADPAVDGGDPVAARVRRAAALRRAGRLRPALAILVDVLEGDHCCRGAWVELGLGLAAAGKRDEARAVFARLGGNCSDDAEVWRGLAGLLRAEGRDDAAEACLRRTLALAPGAVEPLLELAAVQAGRGALEDAADTYRIALAIQPDSVARAGLAEVLAGLGRLDEAAEDFARALAFDDGCAAALFGRARLSMLRGDLAEAWADWEARWAAESVERPAVPGRRWDGRDCPGRTMLVFAERTLADTIQFVRFVPLVAARGATVVLAVQPPLVRLLSGIEGVAQVVALGRALPPDLAVDLNVALMDLPGLLGCSLDVMLADLPYLAAPAERRRVVAPPGTLFKVGLAWHGERREDAIPFADLVGLSALPEAALFSLQTGPRAQDASALAHPALVTDLAPTIADLCDLSARIAEMDLVIAPDCLTAHLAAALGRPVWLLLDAVADPRWMTGRDDSPWYPGMRLFRRQRSGAWRDVVADVAAALAALIGEAREGRDRALLADSGAKAAECAFLARHVAAGDVVLDVGAGSGGFALEAAAHGDVCVLAFEADPARAALLADIVALAGAEDAVEVIAAAAGDCAGNAVVASTPRCGGRRVFPLPEWVAGGVPVLPLDIALADRPDLAGRRLVVRLGARGAETAALAGLWEALMLHHAAVVMFEHRDGDATARMLADSGYALWRLPGAVAAGAPAAFDFRPGAVLALAPGILPAADYGRDGLALAMARARAEAERLAAEGMAAQSRGDLALAAGRYGLALARDPSLIDANANLGILLRRSGHAEAAAALARRALASAGNGGLWSNLGNALRDLDRLNEAEGAYMKALALGPADPDILYNLGLLERDRGRLRETRALFQRSLALKPDAGRRWDLAAAALRAAPPGSAFAELAHRPRPALAPVAAAPWDGGDCAATTILVRDDGDIIDTVLLARFIPQLARRGALATLECSPPLARLLGTLPGLERAVAHGGELPDCELQVRLADLPALLGTSPATLPRDVPYLRLPEGLEPARFPAGRLNVGLAWSGRPGDRFCPLAKLLRLAAWPGVALFSLQRGPRAADLAATGAGAFVDDVAQGCADLADVAAVIAGLDLVIAADAVEAHVAAALGKPAWVLLPLSAAWRWPEGRESTPYYPGMRIFPQSADGGWDHAVSRLTQAVGAMAAGRGRG